ncbi:membrane protein-like protein [Burkholderia sp. H160]|nr:membrane protein-like protein [Burkholderia sp. H160]
MAAPHPSSHAPLNPLPEPPPVSAAMALAHRKYWRFNLALITVLMTLGFFVSFVVPLLASELGQVRVGGFRLPFYVGAQGAILIYLALIVVYIVLMQRADRQLQRAFEADAQRDAASGPTADSTRREKVDTNAPAARGR